MGSEMCIRDRHLLIMFRIPFVIIVFLGLGRERLLPLARNTHRSLLQAPAYLAHTANVSLSIFVYACKVVCLLAIKLHVWVSGLYFVLRPYISILKTFIGVISCLYLVCVLDIEKNSYFMSCSHMNSSPQVVVSLEGKITSESLYVKHIWFVLGMKNFFLKVNT